MYILIHRRLGENISVSLHSNEKEAAQTVAAVEGKETYKELMENGTLLDKDGHTMAVIVKIPNDVKIGGMLLVNWGL